MKQKVFIVLLAIITLTLIGCNSKAPKLYDCSGTVTMNGQPLEGANVAFVNLDLPAPNTAITDASGVFKMQSYEGSFDVTIVKLEGKASKEDPYAPTTNLLPEKYSNLKTSGLKATVTKNPEENKFQFDIQ
ncbi:MAG: carboxypeptidase-like regulatory domain-containing protein [Planctomycetia bacterium]|nr:carboxypeptidase-like regulatory domain-containing protein [Planctomycetia bacterium]